MLVQEGLGVEMSLADNAIYGHTCLEGLIMMSLCQEVSAVLKHLVRCGEPLEAVVSRKL